MYPSAPPTKALTLPDLFLTRFQFGVEVEHWTYDNTIGEKRCTGETGKVDCSGAGVLCSNYALEEKKIALRIACLASWEMARECHAAPRPRWMQDHFGADPWTHSMTVGTGISAAQANVTPCAAKFHGANEGMDGFSDGGHVAWKWYLNTMYGPGASIEAMGKYAGVGFSVFLDERDTYYAILPWLATENWFAPAPKPLELDMQVFIPPNAKTDKNGNTEHVQFWPAGTNPFLPNGGIVCKWGARLKGDKGSKNPDDAKQRVCSPGPGRKWIGCGERASNKGLMVVNDLSRTSGATSLTWLPHK